MNVSAAQPRWRLDAAQVERGAMIAIVVFIVLLASCYAVLFGSGPTGNGVVSVLAFATTAMIGGPLAILAAWPGAVLAALLERWMRRRGVAEHLSAYVLLALVAGATAGTAAWLVAFAVCGVAAGGTATLGTIAALAAAAAVLVGWLTVVLLPRPRGAMARTGR